jgi:ABC-type amino acid transport substrate-binding protein
MGHQDVPRIAPHLLMALRNRVSSRLERLRRIAPLAIALAMPVCSTAATLRTDGVLTVAVYEDFAPFSQGANGEYGGVDVALARALAVRMGLKLKLLPFDAGENVSDDLRNMVWRGDILHYGPADVMMHVPVDRYFAAANDQAVIFGAYYRESLVLVRDTRQLPSVRDSADLVGRFVSAEQGTAAASALLGARRGALREKVKIAPSGEGAMRLLLSGAAAAALVTRAQAEMALRTVADRPDYALSQLALQGLPPGGWAVGMAVKPENADLARRLEAALEMMRADGELGAIFADAGLTLERP